MPVMMRRQLFQELDRIGARVNETEPETKAANMKASDVFPSKYLSADDLDDQDLTVKITHISPEEIGGKPKFILFFAGQKKGLVLNKTNWNTIAAQCGEDSDDWTGKSITLFSTFVDFQGETVAAIRVKPRKQGKTTITTGKPREAVAAHGDPRSDEDME